MGLGPHWDPDLEASIGAERIEAMRIKKRAALHGNSPGVENMTDSVIL
jgi:hypothetical protein